MFRDCKNLLLTGRPGVGKTTLIREVIADLPLLPGGFFTQVIVIDEIGNMEIISGRFRKAVIACLESPVPVLGAIKAGEGPFVSEIKSRPDVEIAQVTPENRSAVKKRMESWLAVFLGDVRGSA